MDKNFDKALTLVLKHEGGWSDHPKDPGGATMKGVTLASFRSFVKADATKEDLRKISDEQLATVYRRNYWDVVAGAQLPGGVDYAVFDFAVNSGPKRAIKALQKVVGVKQDGRVGPATLAAVGELERSHIINALCDDRLAFLKRLKTWSTFGKGWSSRVAGVRKEAIVLAHLPDGPAPVIVEKKVEVEVEKKVIPPKVEHEVKEKTNWLQYILGGGGVFASIGTWLNSADWQTIAAVVGGFVILMLLVLLLRTKLVSAIKELREGLE